MSLCDEPVRRCVCREPGNMHRDRQGLECRPGWHRTGGCAQARSSRSMLLLRPPIGQSLTAKRRSWRTRSSRRLSRLWTQSPTWSRYARRHVVSRCCRVLASELVGRLRKAPVGRIDKCGSSGLRARLADAGCREKAPQFPPSRHAAARAPVSRSLRASNSGSEAVPLRRRLQGRPRLSQNLEAMPTWKHAQQFRSHTAAGTRGDQLVPAQTSGWIARGGPRLQQSGARSRPRDSSTAEWSSV